MEFSSILGILFSESVLDWGITVVLWFQQFSPLFDVLFKSFTFLGNEEFYLLFMPLLYWCLDRRTGALLLMLFLLCAYVNAAAKVLAHQPRPFYYDQRVKQIVPAGGGGFPSGHTQNAVVVWGYLAYALKQKLTWCVAGLLMIAIPLSRIYLGVHFPTDIFGGYLIGAFLLFAFIRLVPFTESWLLRKGIAWQLGAALCLPLVLILASPAGDPGALSGAATLMGFSSGIVLERRWVRFRSGGRWRKQTLRYLLGIAALFGLWLGLRLGFHNLEPVSLFRIVRYAVIGLWSSLGAPWVFIRLKLADRQ